MKLWLLGVRGSTPAPGPEFIRYGGHTSCIAVAPGDTEVPTLVLDAGTGLRSLTAMLPSNAFAGTILLSHLHWDHAQGIPFFIAGDQVDSVVDLYLPAQDGLSGAELLGKMMSPPSFPITPDGLRGDWTFNALQPGRFSSAGFEITATEVAHKGGRTFGYRIEDGTGSIAYLPDHAPAQGCSGELLEMLRDVDILLHDAQFLESERVIADLFGHATIDEALNLAADANAGSVVLFHHGPARTDDQLDAIGRDLRDRAGVTLASQGDVLALPAH